MKNMGKWSAIRRSITLLAGLVACGFMHALPASAQDRQFSQINAQFNAVLPVTSTGITGVVPGISDGNNLTDQPTRAGGFTLKYGYQFDHWIGVDGGFGTARYSQNYSGVFGNTSVQSNLREGMLDFLLHLPVHVSRIHPYLLAGAGAWRFDPTNDMNNAAGASSQTRSSFIFGGGGDFDIRKHIGIRAEYSVSRFRVPGFHVPELESLANTHITQPSIGIYYKFPGFFGIGKGSTSGH